METTIQDTIAILKLNSTYINFGQSPIEAVFYFPLDPEIAVSRLIITIEDKVIVGEVIEKEKAQQKYDDAMARGDTAVKVQEDEKKKDTLKMEVGGIMPD